MGWIRDNALALVIIAAIALSFALNRIDAADRAEHARDNVVAACEMSNTRSALASAYQRRTVANASTPRIARDYAAFSRGSAGSLAIGRFIEAPIDATESELVRRNGKDVMVLTEDAQRLIEEGCERSFR